LVCYSNEHGHCYIYTYIYIYWWCLKLSRPYLYYSNTFQLNNDILDLHYWIALYPIDIDQPTIPWHWWFPIPNVQHFFVFFPMSNQWMLRNVTFMVGRWDKVSVKHLNLVSIVSMSISNRMKLLICHDMFLICNVMTHGLYLPIKSSDFLLPLVAGECHFGPTKNRWFVFFCWDINQQTNRI
jgi:hypothetical protein